MHFLLNSLRWPKKLPRKSKVNTTTPMTMVLERQQYVSRNWFSSKTSFNAFRQSKHEYPCLFPRLGPWWIWWLGIRPWHQILFYIWAPGPWALWLPPATFSHFKGLPWSSGCSGDRCPQSYRENTSPSKSSSNSAVTPALKAEFNIFVEEACKHILGCIPEGWILIIVHNVQGVLVIIQRRKEKLLLIIKCFWTEETVNKEST